MPALNTNGITLTYDTQGEPSGEPILLIMGLGMQLTGWPDAFCKYLVEQGFYVIRFDNRDSGLSTKMQQFGTPNLMLAFVKSIFRLSLKSGYTLDDMANDACGLLDGLGIEKAHVVGASMGGMIAQIVAGKYPQRVSSLVSIMSTSGRRGLPGPTKAARNALLTPPDNPRDMASIIDNSVKVFRVIGSPRYPTPEQFLRDRITASVQRSLSPAGTARQLLAIAASGDRVALLKKIQVPTLVIHGTADPLIPIACGRDAAQLVPNATIHEIDGMGHDSPPVLDERLAGLVGGHCRSASRPAMLRA